MRQEPKLDDTARMTLRWALERISGLEAARDAAARELDHIRQREIQRERALSEKERFVDDLQRTLTAMFKGHVNVAEFQRRRRDLEREKGILQEAARKRLEEASAAHAQAMAEARRRHREELEKLQQRREEDLRTERERNSKLNDLMLAELKLQSDEYHQKSVLLELEYAAKRRKLGDDFEQLKSRILRESAEERERPNLRERELEKEIELLRRELELARAACVPATPPPQPPPPQPMRPEPPRMAAEPPPPAPQPAPRDDDAEERSAFLREQERIQREFLRGLREAIPPTTIPIPAPSLPPLPTPVRRPRLLGALGAVCAAAAAAAFLLPKPPPGRDYPVSFSHPTALAWQGDELWAADRQEAAIYQLRLEDSGLTQLGRYPLAGTGAAGLAVDGNRLYVTDPKARQIQRWILREEGLVLDKTWPSPEESPSALYCDGKSLWSADGSSLRIYRHALDETLTVEASYPLQRPAAGIQADEDGLWSGDARGRRLLRLRRGPDIESAASYLLPELGLENAALSGFVRRGGRVWLALDGENRLRERSWRSFKRAP